MEGYSMLCDKEIMYHSFLCISAMTVITIQATILNFFIIAHFRGHINHVYTYFWFLGDLFIICFVATSCVTAYRYIHLHRKLRLKQNLTEKTIQRKIQHSIYKYVSFLSPKWCGTLPFSFISWFVYSSYLVAKICIIFNSDIPKEMTTSQEASPDDVDAVAILKGGSNILKVSIGSSALVFIIMLQAHHNHDPDSPHSGYIAGICHNTAIEVFDSVTLLSLLFVQESKYLPYWHLDNAIIILSSLNLVLPTLAIYMMSLSDFGRQLRNIVSIKLTYQLLQLICINIPFLGVRMYLWVSYNYKLSLFVVKNLCYIFMLIHSLYPAAKTVLSRIFTKNHRIIRSNTTGEIELEMVTQENNGILTTSSSHNQINITN